MKTKVIVRLLSIGLVFVLALSMTSFTGEAFLENMDASAMYDLLEDALTDEILSGNVKAGDTVSVGVNGKKCVFHVKN